MMTPHEGGSATRLGTLDTPANCWIFDESRRILWVGFAMGGPVRITLVK
jgi:hypothetical protein